VGSGRARPIILLAAIAAIIGTGVLVLLSHRPKSELESPRPGQDEVRGEGPADRAVVLSAPCTIRGRVMDSDGHGVPGARVSVSRARLRDTAQGEGDHEPWSEPVVAGDDGSYAIEGLPLGVCKVFAIAEGYVLSRPRGLVVFCAGGEWVNEVTYPPRCGPLGAEVSGVDVPLERAGVLRVIVTPAWRRVSVSVKRSRNRSDGLLPGGALTDVFTRRADPADAWHPEVLEVPEGKWRVTVERGGWAPAHQPEVRVEPGKTRTVRVNLPRGVDISGTVTGPSGALLSGARVSLWFTGGDDEDPVRVRRERVGEDSRFRFDDLDPQAEYVAVADAPDSGFSNSLPVAIQGGSTGHTLRLRRPGGVRGRVVLEETGEPVRSFRVRLQRQAGPTPFVPTPRDPSARFVSDLGRYRVRGLVPGRYWLVVYPADEQAYPIPDSPTVEIPEGETVVCPDVELVRGSVVWGAVRFDGHEGLQSVRVGLGPVDEWGTLGPMRDSAGGTYRVPGLLAGKYYLFAFGGPEARWLFHWRTLDVTRGAKQRVDLALPGGGGLLLHLVSISLDPIRGARIRLRDAEGRVVPTGADMPEEDVKVWRETLRSIGDRQVNETFPYESAASVSDLRGELLRGCIPPGRISVEIEAQGFETREIEFEIEADKLLERLVILVETAR
jgi:hypothetical protein